MVYSVLFYFIVGIFYRWNILSILSYFITGLFYRGNFLLLEYFTTGMFLYYSGFLHLCLRVCCRKCFGPNLGQSIKKKGESLKSFTDSPWIMLQAHCRVSIWPPTQLQTHLSEGKHFCLDKKQIDYFFFFAK